MMLQKFLPIILVCTISMPATAGGLFGDGGLIRGDIGRALDRVPAKPKITAKKSVTRSSKSFEEALDKPASNTVAGISKPTDVVTYESLWAEKTEEEREYEAWVARNLQVDVSTICVATSTACSVQLTVKGSSCFCTRGSNVELGMVQ